MVYLAPLEDALHMRVAFNAQLLSEPYTGTGRYVYNLLSALGRVDPSIEYDILSAHELPERPETPPSMRWKTAPMPKLATQPAGLEKLYWEQRTFPRAACQASADLLHVPYFAPPLRTFGIPSLVTILDVIPQRLPAYRASSTQQLYSQLVSRSARRAASIIAISNHCKQDIVDTLGIPADRIVVTYLAPDPRLRPASTVAQEDLRRRLGLIGPFILNVGGIDVRKNIAGLIQAFAEVYRQLGNPGLRLFIAGNPAKLGSDGIFPDWRPLAEKLGVTDKLICAPVAEDDLAALYSAADCFAFTSLYEGFGLTPLEAMACGAPVVCSDKTSLPEVVGDAGLLVDPLDTRALSAALLRVLQSAEMRQDLRTHGLAQAAKFTWEQTASDTLAIYKNVVSSAARKQS
jgi:glycosyltransferase involved in cell wall biosynthesis